MYLERITKILEATAQKETASVADICAVVGLPKPTAYRLVQDLASVGLLEAAGQGRFRAGARLRAIARADQSDDALKALIAPTLKRAAQEHGAAFFLSRQRGAEVEIIHVETPDTGVSFLHPGLGKRPIHACSCAKALAAFVADPAQLLSPDRPLRTYTENTICELDAVLAELAQVKAQGYATCVEEIERGLCSVAAPVAQEGFGATMAIGATGSARVFTQAFRTRIGGDLCAMAGEIVPYVKA